MIIGLVEKDLPQIISMVEGFGENLGDRYQSVDAPANYFEKYECRGEKRAVDEECTFRRYTVCEEEQMSFLGSQ